MKQTQKDAKELQTSISQAYRQRDMETSRESDTGMLGGISTSDILSSAGSGIQEFGSAIQQLGDTIAEVGSILFTNLTEPLIGLGVDSVNTAADFESSMSKVKAIASPTGEEFKNLRNLALEMGAATKFTATESAEAFTYMGMAGWKSEQMIAGLPPILKLASASGEDLAKTSDIVTDALTALHMTADDTGKFVDILANTARNANTNVSMMGTTFSYVAPIFGTLGYSAEDASLAIGLMANSGIKALNNYGAVA